ncbi:exostosin-like [Striga asiatica]|uniref:Exostosin-like n=1 Tax=Striga asiatica TaxID=4170 RepID=A0A5A7P2C7_STRAF|nr:exostosin-like [Striga asiatica]
MAASSASHLMFFSHRLLKDSRKGLFLLPVFLAFVSSVFFFLSSTSRLHIGLSQTRPNANPPLEYLKISPQLIVRSVNTRQVRNHSVTSQERGKLHEKEIGVGELGMAENVKVGPFDENKENGDVFHDRTLFTEDYNQMKKSFKIYAYPHEKNDPFANVLLPEDSIPSGNYASESYFKKGLFKSNFLTNDPSQADLFYLPFSIASLRQDPRVGVAGIQDFIKDYISNISRKYPFWNRTRGADHFYVACHSIGRSAMEKAVEVRLNAIQVVCSSSYFLSGYVAHKDSLVSAWGNDSKISVHEERVKSAYSEALMGSKYCIHAKGFEVNTARVADAIYYGCVPVVVADHYELPFGEVLDWSRFSVVVAEEDIPYLKRILEEEEEKEYVGMQGNVMRVREHFQWHHVPVDYDAFHMVMYQLWLRRTGSLDLLHNLLSRRRDSNHPAPTLKSVFFLMPTTLALASSLLILLYISSTSNLFFTHQHHSLHLTQPTNGTFINHEMPSVNISRNHSTFVTGGEFSRISTVNGVPVGAEGQSDFRLQMGCHGCYLRTQMYSVFCTFIGAVIHYLLIVEVLCSSGIYSDNKGPFHDSHTFFQNYKQMNRSLKIYVYPHRKDDPFANILLPVDFEPSGNYASESYFKKALFGSHFLTADPTTADLFFLPFSIARLRHDPRVGTDGIQDFIRDYVVNISREYPFWNNSGGADHFYVACHSIGRLAMEKAAKVKLNAIQVVCSSSYYLSSYVAHKDASLPQIWPRRGNPPNLMNARSKLAFFAGSRNSPVREKLLQKWGNDSEISIHLDHLRTSYSEELLRSKFCLHVKGFEVNTARIGDTIYYGCVPVIIANHYDLPFQDILDWCNFSIVVATLDIPLLKKILKGISEREYSILWNNVLKTRKHFQWHLSPVDYDAFYLVMYELWLRRRSSRLVIL